MPILSNNLTFIIGGARSGKSDFAIQLAGKMNKKVIYLATMEAKDGEMRKRIIKHKKSRPLNWTTVEEPKDIARKIFQFGKKGTVILLDCLTLFLSNLMTDENEKISSAEILKKIKNIITVIKKSKAEIIIVSNEVGQGIVPDNSLAREFRDLQGTINQYFAKAAKNVYWMTAGIPVKIK